MKKLLKVSLLAVLATTLFACGKPSSSEAPVSSESQPSEVTPESSSEQPSETVTTWTVTFYLNNGTEDVYKTLTVEHGKKITETISEPTRNGYTFSGWYVDAAGTIFFDEGVEEITGDKSVYAVWASSGITNPDTPADGGEGEGSGDTGDTGDTTTSELPGTTNAPVSGYALLFNDTNYVSLNAIPEKDYQERDQFVAKGVVIGEGQIFKIYNADHEGGGVSWVEKVLEPYGACEPGANKTVCFEVTDEGIECLVSGTYDIYVKMKWQDNTIYIQSAA